MVLESPYWWGGERKMHGKGRVCAEGRGMEGEGAGGERNQREGATQKRTEADIPLTAVGRAVVLTATLCHTIRTFININLRLFWMCSLWKIHTHKGIQ